MYPFLREGEGGEGTIYYIFMKKLLGNVFDKYTTIFEGSHWGLRGDGFVVFQILKSYTALLLQ